MILSPQTIRERKRWYILKPHPVQLALISDNVRFKCVPAGRRSGKTERFKRYMVKQCWTNPGGLYFIGAPTSEQAERIYWDDLKLLSYSSMHIRQPNETKKVIFFNNGAQLHLVSLDAPDRIEGKNWDGGGIDEFASTKPKSWANISPLFDTERPDKPGYQAWCWFLGVPEGLNHYYDLCNLETTQKDWKTYTWFSSDILSEEAIDSARKRMSAKQFRQEYEASFETATGRIYEEYDKNNYCDDTILPHEEICYFCDFNFTPMSHGLGVVRNLPVIDYKTGNTNLEPHIYLLDEIILTSAKAEQNAIEFVEKYKNHKNKRIKLYGDHSGKNGEKHAHTSEYTSMEKVFQDHGWECERRVLPNPSIKDRQNSVRAKICNAYGMRRLFVNIDAAPYTHRGLSTVQLKTGSSFQEDDKNEYQHITTAIGYFIHYEWPINEEPPDLIISMWGDNPYHSDSDSGETYFGD